MAARRLIIVLLVLFGVSVIAAAIAPDRRGGGLIGQTDNTTTTTQTTTPTQKAPAEPTGEEITARIEASREDPETVKASVGDQLQLYVGSDEARVVELPDFGETETAVENAPAAFNLLLRAAGRFPVIDVDTGHVVGRLEVAERGEQNPTG